MAANYSQPMALGQSRYVPAVFRRILNLDFNVWYIRFLLVYDFSFRVRKLMTFNLHFLSCKEMHGHVDIRSSCGDEYVV